MRITKKALSILLAIAMLITAVPMSIMGFAADVNVGTEPDARNTAQSDTLIRPAVTLTATPVTRITSSLSNPMKGTTTTGYTVAATPSGIPQTSYTYASAAYAGETPTATTIVFAPGREVTDVNIHCSNSSIQYNEATVSNNVYTVTIKDGAAASVGETLIFTVTYKYVYTDTQTGKTYNSDKTFSTTCYSYVDSVLEPAGIYSYRRTNNGWGGTIGRTYINTFIVGEATYSESTNYSGSVNFNAGGFTGDYGKMMQTDSDGNSRRFNSGFGADANRPVTHIYMDKGANATLANLNARVQTWAGNQSDEDDEIPEVTISNLYEYAGNVQTYSKDTEENPSQGNSNSSALAMSKPGGTKKFYTGTAFTIPFTGAGPAQASATADTTATYTITVDLQTAVQWSDVSIRHSHLVHVTVFNKANLLASIQKVMNTEAQNMLITEGAADGKGYNPQEWYYSAGWQAFQSAYNNAVGVYNKPNTTQEKIDAAKTALDKAYNGLTLKEADYTDLDFVVGRANALDKTIYTPASWARLETALAQYQDNINILYQPKLDQITLDIQTAIDNLEYADADYTKVDEQVAKVNELIYNAQENHGMSVEEYYSNWASLVTVLNNCGYAYDEAEGEFVIETVLKRDKQSTVDTYPTTIANAIAALQPNKANFTEAVAAMNNYTMFKNANASYLANSYGSSLDAAYAAVQDYYTRSVDVSYQAEVDAAVAELNRLLANPVYKAANYSAADSAIAKADALDRSRYDDLSRVDAAYEALEALYGLDARHQSEIDAAVKELNDALAALHEVAADYSAVEAAIEAVEQKKTEILVRFGMDASVYYSNWSAVETAVNNVVYDLPFDQQSVIDAYAGAINAALNNLKVAKADYSRLEALEAQAYEILENEANYTTASVEALYEAMFAITGYNLTIDKQATVDQWADDLQIAINNMKFVEADYTSVTVAINDANVKLAESQAFADAHNGVQYYSQETLSALNAAIANVQYGLKKDQQATVNGYATAINNAVAGLAYGPADYTAVEAAKERIPANLNAYTDASVAALNAALNYSTSYMTNRQNKVDEAAAAINKAVDELVPKAPINLSGYNAALAKLAADTKYQTGVYTSASESAVEAANDAITEWLTAEDRFEDDQAELDALVATFDAKIDALAFKPLDTSAYDVQVARIPSNTANYVEETVQAVNTAKAAADAFLAGDVDINNQAEFDVLVAALKAKIDALAFKPIDTTNYEKQVARIPANTASYTDASVKKVNDAKAAVDTFLAGDVNISHQAELDTLVLSLRSAINALAFKPIDTTAYEAQLARIPADTSNYTDASVEAVNDAKAAVDTFLAGNVNINNQAQLDALVATLEAKIDALAFKPIDTTAYDKQVARIPADTSLYTDASVKAVNDAKAAAEAFLAGDVNVTHQAELDELVLALRSAINALTFKPIDTSAYDAQVARIPGDTSGYTDDSVKAVTDAKAAVEAFLAGDVDINNQAELDALVATLKTAIDNLAEKVTAYFQANAESTCVIDTKSMLIYGLETNLTANKLKNTYLDFEGVTITTKAYKGRNLGTGSTVTVEYPDGTVEVYTIVIYGDVDGDAKTATSDINEFEAYLTSSFTLSEAQKKAMNLDNDTRKRINANDFAILQEAVSSGTPLNQVNPAQ